MTRAELIKKIEELKKILVASVATDELTDYAREKAYISLSDVVSTLEENNES